MDRMYQGNLSPAFPGPSSRVPPPPQHPTPPIRGCQAWSSRALVQSGILPESFSLRPFWDLTISVWCRLHGSGGSNNTAEVVSFRNSVNWREPECALKAVQSAAPREPSLCPWLGRSVLGERRLLLGGACSGPTRPDLGLGPAPLLGQCWSAALRCAALHDSSPAAAHAGLEEGLSQWVLGQPRPRRKCKFPSPSGGSPELGLASPPRSRGCPACPRPRGGHPAVLGRRDGRCEGLCEKGRRVEASLGGRSP